MRNETEEQVVVSSQGGEEEAPPPPPRRSPITWDGGPSRSVQIRGGKKKGSVTLKR